MTILVMQVPFHNSVGSLKSEVRASYTQELNYPFPIAVVS